MYFYIANPAAGGGLLEDIQIKLKARLESFDPNPTIVKTTGPNDAGKLTEQALREDYKTIVVIGGDETIKEVINAAYQKQPSKLAIGIIPTGKNNFIANKLGINDWQQACSILANRRLNKFSLLKVNDQLFLYKCSIYSKEKKFKFKADIDGAYRLSASTTKISITNQKLLDWQNPDTLLLKLVSQTVDSPFPKWLIRLRKSDAASNDTRVNFTQCSLSSGSNLSIVADGHELQNSNEVRLERTDYKLTFITSRARS